MPIYSTKPIQEISAEELKFFLKEKLLVIGEHAFFHLSTKQRKIFKEDDLLNTIKRETPRKVYLQENGRYAAYYRKRDGYRKIVLEKENGTVAVVTFMDETEIPHYRL